jgi:hypothetical protein
VKCSLAALVFLVLAGGAKAGAAAADEEDPRPRAALAACARGEVKQGIDVLAELYVQTRNPSFVFNQGRCYQQNGQLELARARFAEYLRVGNNEPIDDIRRAEAFIKEIDDQLARQKLPGPAAAAPAGTSPPDTALLTASASAAPSEGRGGYLRASGIALTVLGVAAIGTGVYLSFKVQALEDDVERRFAMMGVVTDPAALQRELTDGGRYETWQWISYGLGVAALAGAATTFALGGWPVGGRSASEPPAVVVTPVASAGSIGGLMRLRF